MEKLQSTHQGEPVALPERKGTHLRYDTLMPTFSKGWNACLDEIAKLGPLYTRPVQGEPVAWRGLNELGEVVTEWIDGVPPASMVDLCGNPGSFASIELAYTYADPGEVEQFPHGSPANKAVFMALESYTGTTTFEQACLQLAEETRALRAQLAELKEAFNDSQEEVMKRGKMLAEREQLLARCKLWMGLTISGILDALPDDPDGCIPHNLEHKREHLTWLVKKIEDIGPIPERSAPVEIDERAEFLAWANKKYEVGEGYELNESQRDVVENWEGWQARAALEQK